MTWRHQRERGNISQLLSKIPPRVSITEGSRRIKCKLSALCMVLANAQKRSDSRKSVGVFSHLIWTSKVTYPLRTGQSISRGYITVRGEIIKPWIWQKFIFKFSTFTMPTNMVPRSLVNLTLTRISMCLTSSRKFLKPSATSTN